MKNIYKFIHYFRPLYVPVASWYYDNFKAPKRYRHLYESVDILKAKNILEIGVWNGKRAVEMIKIAQAHSSDISYFGFDLFEDLEDEEYTNEISKKPPTKAEVYELLRTTGASITLYGGNTVESLPAALSQLPKMDFVFIDGGHSIETISSDWKYVQELMHDKTIVIFDDYWRNRSDQGAKTIVDSIDRSKYIIEILPEIDKFNNSDFGRLEISFAKVTRR